MKNLAVLFGVHKWGEVEKFHLAQLRKFNPECDATVLSFNSIPDGLKVAGPDDDQLQWWHADMLFWRGVSELEFPRAKRYVFLEWDTFCETRLESFYEHVWKADLAGAKIVRLETEPDWWFKLLEQPPANAFGLRPLCGVFFSREALLAMSQEALKASYAHLFSELRVGVVALELGIKPVEIANNAEIQLWRHSTVTITRGSLWHPVKERQPQV